MRPKKRHYAIAVTADDLETAHPRDSAHCAIAEAINREVGTARTAVDLQTITFTDPKRKERLTYLTPPIAQDHLVSVDKELPLRPFTIVLTKPIQIRAAGGRGGAPAAFQRAEERNERLRDLRKKRDKGTTMTRSDKAALTRMEKRGEVPTPPPRPRIKPAADLADLEPGVERRARVLADESGTQIHGGRPPRATLLSNVRGRKRVYGMRQLRDFDRPDPTAEPGD